MVARIIGRSHSYGVERHRNVQDSATTDTIRPLVGGVHHSLDPSFPQLGHKVDGARAGHRPSLGPPTAPNVRQHALTAQLNNTSSRDMSREWSR